jgi:hypothetical protein
MGRVLWRVSEFKDLSVLGVNADVSYIIKNSAA